MQDQLHVLLPTLGSAGDIHPVIALALALRARGHRTTIFTNPNFQQQIENLGLGFSGVGTLEEGEQVLSNPDLWDARKGFDVIAKHIIIPSIPRIYEAIAEHAGPNTLIASSAICFGARIAHDKLRLPMASVHLQPSVLRSSVDGGMFGMIRISPSQPMWLKKGIYGLIDWLAIDRQLRGPINDFRSRLGLGPIKHAMRGWMHSPQLVIGLFPEWFGPKQPDWPPNTHVVGFVLYDAASQSPVSPEADDFLKSGERPVIFTPGSAAATMHAYFRESVEACRKLGVRAMLVTNFLEQLPPNLPPTVKAFGYLPFGAVLPRAAMLVYHGGVGTMAQTMKAGIPHLVVPHGHDQFDNAFRVKRLGLGESIYASRYRADRVTEAIRRMIADEAVKARCRERARTIDSQVSLTRACELIEDLAARKLAATA